MNSPNKRPAFLIRTVGCKVNQYESQAMREALLKNGFIENEKDEFCDFYIINSCTVTHKADRDTRNLIHRFHRINPEGKIAVAGCYAELGGDRKILSSIPGVKYLIRNSEKESIAEIISDEKNLFSVDKSKRWDSLAGFKNRNKAFLRVQDGCNHRCSYCKVSLVRGPSKSRPIDDIKKEASRLIENGYKEIVLTGICLGSWQEGSLGLPDLVEEISGIDSSARIRLSSIEPIYVTNGLIDMVGRSKNVCKHLHIPLQSGDDKILKLMKRPYTAKKFEALIRKIREAIPDAAFTTDMLLGFPGEDKASFLKTFEFIKKLRPSRMHVFSYSPREGTMALKYRHSISRNEIRERVNKLRALGKELSLDYAKNFIGKREEALIEDENDSLTGLSVGYTGRYIRVLLDGEDSVKNTLTSVRITEVDYAKNRVFGHLDNGHII